MNLTEIANKLADGQVEIYNICKRSAERTSYAYELIAALVEVTSQLEQAVGDNPSSQQFQAIFDKATAAQQDTAADMAAYQAVIDALPDFAPGLRSMAQTPFDQPPAAPAV